MRVTLTSYLAEYIGTVFFILIILASGGNAIAIGIALATIVFLIGQVSGASVNPAVSLSYYLNGMITSTNLFVYVLVQFLGGVTAYYAYKSLY